jgi:hypothetical protein
LYIHESLPPGQNRRVRHEITVGEFLHEQANPPLIAAFLPPATLIPPTAGFDRRGAMVDPKALLLDHTLLREMAT